MKVAYLSNQAREVKSGLGRFAEYLRAINGKNGLEFTFFSPQFERNDVGEIRVPIPAWAQKIPFSSYIRGWWFRRSVSREWKKGTFDAILAADYSMAMFLPPDLKKKTAVMINDDNSLLIYSPDRKLGKVGLRALLSRKLSYFFERQAAQTCGLTVSNSQHTGNLILRIYQIPPDRLFRLYKAVDLAAFRFREIPIGEVRRLLFVKNDWRRGGLDLVLEALGKIPDGERLTLAMAGVEEKDHSLIQTLGKEAGFRGKLEFLGILNRGSLITELNRADVFLNFSRQEALGVSCLEALAAGVPVVASDAGGLKEVLDSGRVGWQVPAEDVDQLAACIRHLMQNPAQLEEKRQAGRVHADSFSVEKLEQNLVSLFQALKKTR